MNRTIYMAYGSNLNREQMAHRCPTARVLGSAELTDHRLLFRGRAAWLAHRGCLLLSVCDMLPFKQPPVNLFGTCCSLAEDPEVFTMGICFPLCP